MKAQDVIVQKIKDISDSCHRGEITNEEANTQIAALANVLRQVMA